MEYTINNLARMSGISSRTLRHYDQIGLLKPLRVSSTRYRIYGEKEVDKLQQILFYRELGIPLLDIKEILEDKSFNPEEAMKRHLTELENKKSQIEILINNIEKTLQTYKGETTMKNKEKFEGFKKNLIEENEKKYGKEIREKYGEETVEKSNQKLMDMTEEQYNDVEILGEALNKKLKEATEAGDPTSELAQEVCDLHRRWLTFYWPEGAYNKEAHMSLVETYTQDERFKEYYEKIAPGAADFLYEAIKIYCA